MTIILNKAPGYMYRLIFFIPLFTLFSCNFNRSDNRTKNSDDISPENKVDPDRLAQMKYSYAIDYYDALDLLDKGDLKSIDTAITMFKNSSADSLSRESARCDSMFVGLNDFVTLVIQNYYEYNLNGNKALKGKIRKGSSDADISGFVRELNEHGIRLSSADGECYLETDQGFLFENLKGNLSVASSEFLRLRIMDQKSSVMEDNKLTFSADSLAKKVIAWEDFIRCFPSYISINEAQNLYSDCLSIFLAGTDNSPVFDLDTKKLDDHFKTVYESYIQNYPERESAKVVKEYYNLLSTNEFKFSDKAGEFLMEKITP